jgi:hypothetical protein
MPSTPLSAGSRRPEPLRQRSAAAAAQPSAAEASNASAQAANAALRQLLDERRRRQMYGPAVVQRQGFIAEATDDILSTAGDLTANAGLPLLAVFAVVLLVASVAAGCWLVAARTGRGAPGTTIAGKVLFDGKPLTQAALEFHATHQADNAGSTTLQVETNHEGAFLRIAAVPAGTYAVVVKSGCIMPDPTAEIGKPVRIPAKYTSLSSTPLAVEFRKEPSTFRIVLRN